jgi:hypothetical protein
MTLAKPLLNRELLGDRESLARERLAARARISKINGKEERP